MQGKIRYLIGKYKGAKEWNLNHSVGHRWQAPF